MILWSILLSVWVSFPIFPHHSHHSSLFILIDLAIFSWLFFYNLYSSIYLVWDHLGSPSTTPPKKTWWYFNEIILNFQMNLGRTEVFLETFYTKASYVSPFIHVFFLCPFIKLYCFLHICSPQHSVLKGFYGEIAIEVKAWNTLSLASKIDP